MAVELELASVDSQPICAWWLRPFVDGKWRNRISSCLLSLSIHLAVLIGLAVFVTIQSPEFVRVTLVVCTTELAPADDPSNLVPELPTQLDALAVSKTDAADSFNSLQDLPALEIGSIEAPTVKKVAVLAERPAEQSVAPETTTLVSTETIGFPKLAGYEGRKGETKQRLLAARGGNQASEDAVEKGLAWLAQHQRKDGGWRFDLREAPCEGRCGHSGTIGTTTGATALSLLSFLGAGYLPGDPKYGTHVQRGIYYLQNRMLITHHGGDLQDGSMYGHGLATMAMCEAYALTHDEALRPFAQHAIDFTCRAQHKQGGWRYYPGQPGDTTVFGWQFMSLKSAQLGGLIVPSPVIEKAKEYLDSVQASKGAFYGYQKAEKDPTATAVGLLSRMYCGWPRHDLRLQLGVDYLAKRGPSLSDMYFNYYATQVLHHYDGSTWGEWNRRLRDHLLATQARTGHEAGSWHFTDKHGSQAGRLYTTAMCVMILEVYYRHMPVYGEKSLQGF